MFNNYLYNNINDALPDLLNELLHNGDEVGSRNGRTKELPFIGITLTDPLSREMLLPGRKHNIAAQIAETMWVLAGRNDIAWLANYLPRATDFSDDGLTWRAGYGPRLRDFGPHGIDQMQYVLQTLQGAESSRQAVVSLWDPSVDTQPLEDGSTSKDIACNNWLHFLSRDGNLDLVVGVRSNDAMWGWSGINAFEWSALLEMLANMLDLNVGSLHFAVSSFHLYEQHWEKADHIIAYASDHYQQTGSPRFTWLLGPEIDEFDHILQHWFGVEALIRSEAANGPLSTEVDSLINDFSEPMLQSWLRVLAWWWTGNDEYLRPLEGTDLALSCRFAMQPPNKHKVNDVTEAKPQLIDRVCALHTEKDKAYGDSWCRRGEMLGIMANIARKIDRLGGSETADETSLDTAMDLFVYLGKYLAWTQGVEDAEQANNILREVADTTGRPSTDITKDWLEKSLADQFGRLEELVVACHYHLRDKAIQAMLPDAWLLVQALA